MHGQQNIKLKEYINDARYHERQNCSLICNKIPPIFEGHKYQNMQDYAQFCILFNVWTWALMLREQQMLSVRDKGAEEVEGVTGHWRKFRNEGLNNALCFLFSAYRNFFPWG